MKPESGWKNSRQRPATAGRSVTTEERREDLPQMVELRRMTPEVSLIFQLTWTKTCQLDVEVVVGPQMPREKECGCSKNDSGSRAVV